MKRITNKQVQTLFFDVDKRFQEEISNIEKTISNKKRMAKQQNRDLQKLYHDMVIYHSMINAIKECRAILKSEYEEIYEYI